MNGNKYLILKGCAGLGNRMYTVSRAIEYALSNNRKIYVDWSDGQFDKKGVNLFYDYFEIDESVGQFEISEIKDDYSVYPKLFEKSIDASVYDLFRIVNREGDTSFKDKVLHKLTTMFNFNYGEKLFGYWYPISYGGNLTKRQRLKGVFFSGSLPLGALMKNERKEDVVIFADFSPEPNRDILLNKVRLKSALQEKISVKAKQLGLTENCVGVHVRYTDKKPTKSLDALLVRCKSEVANGKRVFLATDNADIEKQFKDQFGEKLLLNAKLIPEESNETGLHRWAYNDDSQADLLRRMFQESIEDMWLLAECKVLFYQGNSSFSVFSSIVSDSKTYDWLKFDKE